MSNPHLAYSTLEGLEVQGYKVRLSHATANLVEGELVRESRLPLPFTIEAEEHQFKTAAIQSDIKHEFAQYIKQDGLAPVGQHHLVLKY